MTKLDESSFKQIISSVERKEPVESYKSVDCKLDEMLSVYCKEEKQTIIKTFISYCEGRMNNALNVSFLAIAYALLTSGLTMAVSDYDSCTKAVIMLFFAASAGLMTLGAWNTKKEEFKFGFAYKILCFKLEELSNSDNRKKEKKAKSKNEKQRNKRK